ncbi:hypothetical protein [Endozoicomonas montiporae]|nr:hypothetical protein [Endozoicomonas montiporae]
MERSLLSASKVPVEAAVQRELLPLVLTTLKAIQQGTSVEANLKQFEQLAEQVSHIGEDDQSRIAAEKQEHKQSVAELKLTLDTAKTQPFEKDSAATSKKTWRKQKAALIEDLEKQIEITNEQFSSRLSALEKEAEESNKRQLTDWKEQFTAFTQQAGIKPVAN